MKRPSHKEINRKIAQAKEALFSNQIFFVNAISLAADVLELDLTVKEVPEVLFRLLREITPKDYAGHYPPQRSYEDEILQCELFPFKWKSSRLGCVIYLKFTVKNNQLWIISLHEDRKERS